MEGCILTIALHSVMLSLQNFHNLRPSRIGRALEDFDTEAGRGYTTLGQEPIKEINTSSSS